METELVGTVCLFGARTCGFGFIAQTRAGVVGGTGEPAQWRDATAALWLGCFAITDTGILRGRVMVMAPGGERVAFVQIGNLPTFGELRWQAAPAPGQVAA